MLDQRTDEMILSYMKWTNKKVLSPEEYLMFRRQAIEEEFAGIPEPTAATQAPKTENDVEHSKGRKMAPQASTEPRADEVHKKCAADAPCSNKGAPASNFASNQQNQEKKNQENKKDEKGFGMSNADLLAFMQSVPD